MAFKGILALSLMMLIIWDQFIEIQGEQDMGGSYGDMKEMGKGGKMEMKGKPMMCYQKKVMVQKKKTKDSRDQMSQNLMREAAKLLKMVMKQVNESAGMDMQMLQQVTTTLQNMMKGGEMTTGTGGDMTMGMGEEDGDGEEEGENTDLGLELLGIVQRLVDSGQVDGVTVTSDDSEEEGMMKDMGPMPMNDEPSSATKMPAEEGGLPSLPAGLDLTTLGLTMEDLLNLIRDPSFGFVLQSFGLGGISQYLSDPDILDALSQLDIETFNNIIQSGEIFTASGQVNLELIQSLGTEMGKDGDKDGMGKEEDDKEESSGDDDNDDDVGMSAFEKFFKRAGVKGRVTRGNVVPAVLQAIQVILNANETTLIDLFELLNDITPEEIEMWEMSMEKDMNKTSMMKGKNAKGAMKMFSMILQTAGIEGEVTEENLVASVIKALNYTLNADEDSVEMLLQKMLGLDMPKTEPMKPMEKENNELMAAFAQIMRMTGVEGEVTEENLFQSMMQAMQYVMTADKESLQRLLAVFQTMQMTGPVTSGSKSMEEMRKGQDKELIAMFDRIMALAGVGEVSEENLMESVMKAIQFLTSADEETVEGITKAMNGTNFMSLLGMGKDGMERGQQTGESNFMTTTGMGKQGGEENTGEEDEMDEKDETKRRMLGKDMNAMKEMDKKDRKNNNNNNIMAAFRKILEITGVEGEVTEENVLEKTLIAMQFIMQADEATVTMILEQLDNIDLDMSTMVEEDKDEMEKERYEMVCYPMSTADMKKFRMQESTGMDDDEDEGRNRKDDEDNDDDDDDDDVDDDDAADNDKNTRRRGMSISTCGPCRSNDEMQTMMKEMVEKEVSRVFADIAMGMNGENFVSPQVKTFLVKMANGMMTKDEKPEREIEDKWEEWSVWGMCSQTCGDGTKIRTRTCKESYLSTVEDAEDCEDTEQNPCNLMSCETGMKVPTKDEVSKWGPWNEWGDCSVSCDGGMRYRTRTCEESYQTMDDDQTSCEQTQSKRCNEMSCPTVEISWMAWESWTTCSATCGGGMMKRSRKCSDMTSTKSCMEEESQMCSLGPCPSPTTTTRIVTVAAGATQWLTWESWSTCSATCGVGTIVRRRGCVRQLTTQQCQQVQTQSCTNGPCDTGTVRTTPSSESTVWKQWEAWTPCSLTCGLGYQTRKRTCNSPNLTGSRDCVDFESQTCMDRTCPFITTTRATGQFTNWGRWTTCTRQCGGGTRSRRRFCAGGAQCQGDRQQVSSCNNFPCSNQPSIPPIRPTTMMNYGVTHRITSKVPQTSLATQTVHASSGSCPASRYRRLSYKGHCIVFHGREAGKMTFTSYRNYCQQRGGDVLRTESVDKWVQVAYWIRSIVDIHYSDKTGLPWIGATDAGNRNRWVHPADISSGGARAFMIWSRGQPQAASYDQCAIFNVETGHAFSDRCTASHYAICEYRTG